MMITKWIQRVAGWDGLLPGNVWGVSAIVISILPSNWSPIEVFCTGAARSGISNLCIPVAFAIRLESYSIQPLRIHTSRHPIHRIWTRRFFALLARLYGGALSGRPVGQLETTGSYLFDLSLLDDGRNVPRFSKRGRRRK